MADSALNFSAFSECESSSAGRAPRCQRGCRGFESRLSLSDVNLCWQGFFISVRKPILPTLTHS